MCGKPGKGRHGTSHHAKAIYQIISSSRSWDNCYESFHYSKQRGLYCNHLVRPLVCPSVRLSIRSHFCNRYLSFYWKKWFYIWYVALAWWPVPCLPFPGLPHIYFLFTVRLRIFHVCRNENFRNRYLSLTIIVQTFFSWHCIVVGCMLISFSLKTKVNGNLNKQDVARYVVLRIPPLVHL
jgi:hypothetical protein